MWTMGEERLPEQYRNQIKTADAIETHDAQTILAVQLHKAKFHQRKALDEYTSNQPLSETIPQAVVQASQRLTDARGEVSTSLTTQDAWSGIATDEHWIGALPIQMYREREDVYLRGYPFIIGFQNGKPRVILNKILVSDSSNMSIVYGNEWARPWVIAQILDATRFDTKDLVLATMKADTARYTDFSYLRQIASRTVATFLEEDHREKLPADRPHPWDPPEQEEIKTELLCYDSNRSLLSELGYGDSIRDLIQMFLGHQSPKGIPPDWGRTL